MKKLILDFRPLILRAFLSGSFLALSACGKQLVDKPRENEFYMNLVNAKPTAESSASVRVMEENKILFSEDYPLRIALFENGSFDYEIDKLGEGKGNWKIVNGALALTAVRPIFDITMMISGKDSSGSQAVLKFFDCHGLNAHVLSIRDPVKLRASGEEPPVLKQFSKSTLGL